MIIPVRKQLERKRVAAAGTVAGFFGIGARVQQVGGADDLVLFQVLDPETAQVAISVEFTPTDGPDHFVGHFIVDMAHDEEVPEVVV